MVHIEHSVVIQRPCATVFAALTDFAHTPEWQPQVIEERPIPAGPVAVDTQIYQARRFMGRRIESTSRVVEFVPDARMVNRSAPDVVPGVETAYILTPVGGGTQLTFHITLTGRGIGWQLLQPIMRRALRGDVVQRFRTLKTRLEAS